MDLATVFQIALPYALLGLVVIGGASPRLALRLGLRRRPFRLGRRRPVARAARGAETPGLPSPVPPARAAACRAEGFSRLAGDPPQRRAA